MPELQISKRVSSIDFTRGLVMIIMALDHTRDFTHISSLTQSPTDLNTTTPALFFTRWITHLCAPVFVFLSGASAYLLVKKEGNYTKSRNFLLSRGIWLLLVEFTAVNFALWFDLRFRTLIFEVIAAIGFGFIMLALLLKLSAKAIAAISLAIIFLHDFLLNVSANPNSPVKIIISALFGFNIVPVTPQLTFVVGYPPIPWLGLMLAGFVAGRFFELDQKLRKETFFKIGIALLVLFTILRFFNFYGDPVKWSAQKNSIFTFLSFINVSKYPPSLLFCLVTTGVMFLILSLSEKIKNKLAVVTVYGKVPLFYFLIHLYILHILMLAMVFLQGFKWRELIFGVFSFGRPAKGSGVGLFTIYLIWVIVVISLYPFCKWYGAYKANHSEKKWLRYL